MVSYRDFEQRQSIEPKRSSYTPISSVAAEETMRKASQRQSMSEQYREQDYVPPVFKEVLQERQQQSIEPRQTEQRQSISEQYRDQIQPLPEFREALQDRQKQSIEPLRRVQESRDTPQRLDDRYKTLSAIGARETLRKASKKKPYRTISSVAADETIRRARQREEPTPIEISREQAKPLTTQSMQEKRTVTREEVVKGVADLPKGAEEEIKDFRFLLGTDVKDMTPEQRDIVETTKKFSVKDPVLSLRYLGVKAEQSDKGFLTDDERQAFLAETLGKNYRATKSKLTEEGKEITQPIEKAKQQLAKKYGQTELVENVSPEQRKQYKEQLIEGAEKRTGKDVSGVTEAGLNLYIYQQELSEKAREITDDYLSKDTVFYKKTPEEITQLESSAYPQSKGEKQLVFTDPEERKEYIKDLNKLNKKLETSSEDIDKLKFTPEQKEKLKNISEKEKKLESQYEETLEKIREIDPVYSQKQKISEKIKGKTYEEGTMPVITNIGRVAEKNIGGTVVGGVQGLLGFATDKGEDFGETEETLKKYDIVTEEEKVLDFAKLAGVTALASTGIGAASAVGGVSSALVAPEALSETQKAYSYKLAPEEEKEYRGKYKDFYSDIRTGLRSEKKEIKEGWGEDGKFGSVRSFISEIPLGRRIPGIGGEEEFLTSVEERLRERGYEGEELQTALDVLKKQRRADIYTETGSIFVGNIGAELVGRFGITKSVLKGLGKKKALSGVGRTRKGFTSVGSAGVVEGTIVESAKQTAGYKDLDVGRIGEAGGIGYLTAGAIGGGMAYSGTGGKLTKVLSRGGYITDIYEYPADKAADVAAKLVPTVSKYTGRIRPKRFTLVSRDAFSKEEPVNVDVSKIREYKPSTGGVIITTKDDKTINIPATQENVQTLQQMNEYTEKELEFVKQPQKSKKQPIEKSFTEITEKTKTQPMEESTIVPALERPQILTREETLSKSQSQPQTKIESLTQINQQTKTRSQPKTRQQTQTQPQTQTQSQALTQSMAQTQVQSQTLAETPVSTFSSAFPAFYPKTGLGRGRFKFGRGTPYKEWVVTNPFKDLASEFFGKSKKTTSIKDKATESFKKKYGGKNKYI